MERIFAYLGRALDVRLVVLILALIFLATPFFDFLLPFPLDIFALWPVFGDFFFTILDFTDFLACFFDALWTLLDDLFATFDIFGHRCVLKQLPDKMEGLVRLIISSNVPFVYLNKNMFINMFSSYHAPLNTESRIIPYCNSILRLNTALSIIYI